MRLFVPRPAAAMTYRVLIVFAAVRCRRCFAGCRAADLGHDLGEDRPFGRGLHQWVTEHSRRPMLPSRSISPAPRKPMGRRS